MALPFGTLLDRTLAVLVFVFGACLITAVCIQDQGVFGMFYGAFLGLMVATPVAALLWISRAWSLVVFGLSALPYGFFAYVFCDLTGPGPATDVLHWTPSMIMWGLPYGVIRSLICVMLEKP